jgi:outer membrane receptor protein involved in Fe transport
LFVISTVATPVLARTLDLDRVVKFSIKRQSIESALLAFSKQAGIQLLISPNVNGTAAAPALNATVSARVALDALLRNSGLTYAAWGESVNVIRVSDISPSHAVAASANRTPSGASTAGVEQGADTPGLQMSGRKQTTDREREAERGFDDKRQQSGTLEEVIVSAQKREERLIDVPISMVVMGSDELLRRQVTNLNDLSGVVPGLYVEGQGNTRVIEIRGISNTFGAASLVGLYLDDAVVTSGGDRQLDLNTYDLERVEVLRGPQGTLYGEGSAGGTIRLITKSPVLDKFAMNADVSALFTEDGAPGQRINAAINVPLIDNQLGLRIAGAFDHEGGWVNQPTADRKDINDQNLADVRIKGLWKPTPRFALSALAEIHRNNTTPDSGEDSNGNYTQTFGLTTTPRLRDDYEIYNLTLTHDFQAVRLVSTTTDVHQNRVSSDFGYSLPFLGPRSEAPAFDVLFPSEGYARRVNALSQELRLTSIGSKPWRWTAGAFYRRFQNDTDARYVFGIPVSGDPLPPFFYAPTRSLSKSWAVFGDTSYNLTDQLTFGVGARYFQDDQDYKSNTPFTLQTGRFHSLDPRFYAQYKPIESVTVYTSAAKGFRSGGFNAENQPSYGPEKIWTYELGTKMSLLGGRLSGETAVFYTDYTNYVISGIQPPPAVPVNIFSNAGSAKIKGIEWGLTWLPFDQWSVSVNGNYLTDYSIYKVTVAEAPFAVGDRLDSVPKYTFTGSVQRDFDWNGRPIYVRLDYNQKGRMRYGSPTVGLWYFSDSDIIHMLNFNAGLQWSDGLSMGFFAQNLLNDRGYVDADIIENYAARARPRTYGVNFSVRF